MAQLAVAAVMFVASAYKGMEEKKAKIEEAAATTVAGHRRMAAATREVSEESKLKERMQSRAVAVAAFNGGGVDNPNVVKILGDLNAEGQYRMMAKLWQGQNDAEGLYFRAEAARREGDAAFNAGIVNGVVSAVSAYVGMGGGFPGGNTIIPGTAAPAYSPIPGGAPSLWSAPGSVASSGQFSPVNAPTLWR